MANNMAAINESEINKLIVEIIDYSSKIKTILNRVNDLVSETKSYYNCSSGSLLRSKYALFNDNYRIIVKNISSYSKDLNSLKRKFSSSLEDLSVQVKRDANNQASEVSSVIYKEGR